MDVQKIKDALKLIKEAFAAAQVVQKFTEEKLSDGVTIISYDADVLAVGVAVMAVTESGKMPLPDGDYTTADGDTFTIATGVVTAAKEVDAPADPANPDTSKPSTPAAAAQMTEGQAKSIIESVIRESRFAEDISELKTALEEFEKAKETFATQKAEDKTTIENLTTELKESKELMLKAVELIEKVADLPSETPAASKQTFNIKDQRAAFKADLDKLTEKN